MRIAIITDAWEPQVNGVVRTYQNITKDMHSVQIIHPYLPGLKRFALPNYPEIEVVYNPWEIKQKLWVLMHENYYDTYCNRRTLRIVCEKSSSSKKLYIHNKLSYIVS
jgi:hypothetical protein